MGKKVAVIMDSLALRKLQELKDSGEKKAGAVEEKQGIEGEGEERRQAKGKGRNYWGAA